MAFLKNEKYYKLTNFTIDRQGKIGYLLFKGYQNKEDSDNRTMQKINENVILNNEHFPFDGSKGVKMIQAAYNESKEVAFYDAQNV